MGGKAFEGKVRRITKDEVFQTIQHLAESTSLDHTYLRSHLLGSAGKNDDSGDIDINMDDTKFDLAKIADELIELLGKDNVKSRPGNNQIFTCFPIAGDPENGFVQIDFMFGNVKWQAFSYASARYEKSPSVYISMHDFSVSRYKGLYRTELLKALTAYNSDWVYEENGEMVARVGPTFFHDKGLVWRYRYRPYKKGSTTERIQAFKEVSKEEFLQIFPSAEVARCDIMDDPTEVLDFLFSDYPGHTQIADAMSYESLWNYTKWQYPLVHREVINKLYLERLNSLRVEIPPKILKTHSPRKIKDAVV